MVKRISLVALLLASASCESADKEQEIFDFINMGEPESALSVLTLSECERYLDACAHLGIGLIQYEPFIKTGKEYLTKAATAGHPRANVIVGNFMIAGNIYEKDPATGIRLLEKSVGLGASEGMYYLANEYHDGVNIERNDSLALDLYMRASALGHLYAPFNAGVLHWEKYQDCKTTKNFFAMSAVVMNEAEKALEEIRTMGPCVDVLTNGDADLASK